MTYGKMKGNNGKGNNSLRDGWRTPCEIFDPLDHQYEFTFDCCASEHDKKCDHWHDDFESVDTSEAGLSEDDVAWMNPPFSIAWRMFEHFFKVIDHGVAIYRCDNLETGLWQKLIFKHADWVFIPKGRVSYEGLDGDGARFPSALIGVGVEPPIYLIGTVLKVEK